MRFCDRIAQLTFQLQSRLRASPRLYQLYRSVKRVPEQYADANTDVVIEGPPRSANSFAVRAFESAQSDSVNIGHHLHAPAHVLRGCSLGLPTLVLIRDPRDYVISRKAFHLEVSLREQVCHPHLAATSAMLLRDWCRFYETIWPRRDEFVVATFETVTSNFGAAIERLNEFFGTAFETFDGDQTEVEAIHRGAGYHAGPSGLREQMKAQLQKLLTCPDNPPLEPVLDKARNLYSTFLQRC